MVDRKTERFRARFQSTDFSGFDAYDALSPEGRLAWLLARGKKHQQRYMEYGAREASVRFADMEQINVELLSLESAVRLCASRGSMAPGESIVSIEALERALRELEAKRFAPVLYVSLAKAPEWKRGYWAGRTGKALKIEDTGKVNKAALAGYATGRRVYCWGLWCNKHGRKAVYDGTPHPENDPLPSTAVEIDSWLAHHGHKAED